MLGKLGEPVGIRTRDPLIKVARGIGDAMLAGNAAALLMDATQKIHERFKSGHEKEVQALSEPVAGHLSQRAPAEADAPRAQRSQKHGRG